MAKSDGIWDGLGNPIPARARQAMVNDREPLLNEPTGHCTVPGCLRDVRADGLCIEHLEVREIARPYGLDIREVRLAEDCACLVRRTDPTVVVLPCTDHTPRPVGETR